MKDRAPFSRSPLLTLKDLRPAVFLERKNRFVAVVEMDGCRERVHVADPGRLRELLYPGNAILVRRAERASGRKTLWSLMAGMGENGWVLLNTFLHRRIAENLLQDPSISPFGKLAAMRAEVTPSGCSSRFDFMLRPEGGERVWLEVKGCTLRKGALALFPDAPTTRGARHLRELGALAGKGEICAVMFLVFPEGVQCFAPNEEMDPDFSMAFRNAVASGVSVHPVGLSFDGSRVVWQGTIPLCEDRSRTL